MTNLVIAYTGNVCSTPMVEYARLTGAIWVPVLEQFDRYMLDQVWTDGAEVGPRLAATLDALYRRERSDYLDLPQVVKYNGGTIPAAADKPHILFKWRPLSHTIPGGEALTRVFGAHDVRPVVIVRRSLCQQALKVFLSEKIYDGRHQQFKAGKLSEAAYAEYLEAQAGISVTLDPAEIAEVKALARNFLERTEKLVDSMRAFFPGRPLPVIVAEDIFDPAIDRARFEAILGRLLEDDLRLPADAEPMVRKGGLDVSNCANAAEVLSRPGLVRIEALYQELLGGLERISPAPAPAPAGGAAP